MTCLWMWSQPSQYCWQEGCWMLSSIVILSGQRICTSEGKQHWIFPNCCSAQKKIVINYKYSWTDILKYKTYAGAVVVLHSRPSSQLWDTVAQPVIHGPLLDGLRYEKVCIMTVNSVFLSPTHIPTHLPQDTHKQVHSLFMRRKPKSQGFWLSAFLT